MIKVYNKLIRDKVPEVTIRNGGKPVTRILSDEEYLKALVAKLGEECAEFTEALSIEELADIQEVVLALADTIASREALEQARVAKAEARGTFTQKIFLESVDHTE
jgi:predicted house-cleaning noncanonical NTP pyrophosphatase (MazG superfamily)